MLRASVEGMLKAAMPMSAKVAIRSLLGRKPASSHNDACAREAAQLVPIRSAKVLVVGANRGIDCKRFIDLGAPEVHGLDVVDDVGFEFQHDRVTYHRQSIEAADLPSQAFDLVYCFATMEHVPNIAAGFREMARLVKPGGAIYSVAAPLWHSPYGHHMNCFEGYPWVHLALTKPEIMDYCAEHGIAGERGHTIEAIVDYMLNPEFFNMRHAAEYTEACERLSGVRLVKNALLNERSTLLRHPLAVKAMGKGFTRTQLLAETHKLVAVGI